MKSLKLIALPVLLALPVFTVSAQTASAPMPQLIISGDQWVVQVPPGTPVPQNIVLQLSAPSAAPAPGVVIQQPPGTQVAPVAVEAPAPAEVYVESAPPPPPVEVIPVAPDHYHVWISGHYEWTHHGYFWRGGHWERPPHHGAHWAGARWEMRGNRYVYIEGRWDR